MKTTCTFKALIIGRDKSRRASTRIVDLNTGHPGSRYDHSVKMAGQNNKDLYETL